MIWPQANKSPVYIVSLSGVSCLQHPQKPCNLLLRHLRQTSLSSVGEAPFQFRPPVPPLRPPLPPRWVLVPAPPWQRPGLRWREELSLTPRSQSKSVQVGNAGRKLRGPPGAPSADKIRADLSFPVGTEGGWGWPGASSAGGAGGVRPPEGAGALPAQRVLEPAGCPRGPAAADA